MLALQKLPHQPARRLALGAAQPDEIDHSSTGGRARAQLDPGIAHSLRRNLGNLLLDVCIQLALAERDSGTGLEPIVFDEVKFLLYGAVVRPRAIEQQRQNERRQQPNSPHALLYGPGDRSVSNWMPRCILMSSGREKLMARKPNYIASYVAGFRR